jgi:hypothetical protein
MKQTVATCVLRTSAWLYPQDHFAVTRYSPVSSMGKYHHQVPSWEGRAGEAAFMNKTLLATFCNSQTPCAARQSKPCFDLQPEDWAHVPFSNADAVRQPVYECASRSQARCYAVLYADHSQLAG